MKPSVLAHVKHILLTLKQSWSTSGDPNAFKCSQILNEEFESELDEIFAIKSSDIVSAPSGLCLQGNDPADAWVFNIRKINWYKLMQ